MTAIDGGMLHYGETRFDRLRGGEERLAHAASEDVKLREVCRDFEAIFIKQMLDSMRKTVQKTGLVDGGMAENIFEDMLYDERARIMSRTGSFGIADLLYRQFRGPEGNS